MSEPVAGRAWRSLASLPFSGGVVAELCVRCWGSVGRGERVRSGHVGVQGQRGCGGGAGGRGSLVRRGGAGNGGNRALQRATEGPRPGLGLSVRRMLDASLSP